MCRKPLLMIVLAIGLAAFSIAANGQHPPQHRVIERSPNIMQIALDLTDVQATVVDDLMRKNRTKMAQIVEISPITHHDLGLLRGLTDKFSETGAETFKNIFNKEELQNIDSEIFRKSPLGYIISSENEKMAQFQALVSMDAEQTRQLRAYIADETSRQKVVLENLGFDIMELKNLHKAFSAERQALQESLHTVLNEEQFARLLKFREQMEPRGQGHFPPPPHKGVRR